MEESVNHLKFFLSFRTNLFAFVPLFIILLFLFLYLFPSFLVSSYFSSTFPPQLLLLLVFPLIPFLLSFTFTYISFLIFLLLYHLTDPLHADIQSSYGHGRGNVGTMKRNVCHNNTTDRFIRHDFK